ncbi:MAG: tetratricopeptide repeat protein [Henriciella sp.]|nr:tetratricopeptide repeat protein [Henriciella sp.]
MNSRGLMRGRNVLISIVFLVLQLGMATAQTSPEPEPSSEGEIEWSTLNQSVLKAYETGQYRTGLELAATALEVAEETFGDLHQNTITAINNLATMNSLLGRRDEAERLYDRTLDLSRTLFGPNHPSTLRAVTNLAVLYDEQGRWDDAETYYQLALRGREAIGGKDDPATLMTANNLATMWLQQSRYGKAEPLMLDTLERRRRVLGKNDPATLTSESNLAQLYLAQGRIDEAEPIFIRVLLAREVVLGQLHPDTTTTLNNIAAFYKQRGRLAEAERYFNLALERYEQSFGAQHPLTLLALNNVATVHIEQGKYETAARALREALAGRDAVLGAIHPETLISVKNLADAYKALGQYAEAKDLYIRALLTSDLALSPTHLDRALYHAGFADFLLKQAEPATSAIVHLKVAVNVVQSARAEMAGLSSETQAAFLDKNAFYYERLQKLLIEAGRFAEAEQVGRMLKEQEYFEFIRRSTRGEDPRETLADLTPLESQWADQFAAWSERPNKIAVTLAALKTKQRSGTVLTALEDTQLTDLQAQYDTAYADYKQQVNTWLASVRDLSDETIQAEARALEARFHDDLQGEIADIGDEVAALQVVAFEDSLHFFLITPRAFKHIETPVKRADLNEAIFAARRAVQPDPVSGFLDPDANAKLKALHDLLFAPVEQELADAGTETLMLNLQGAIRYVPFAALYDGDQYLTERYQLALFTPAARTRFEAAEDMSEGTGFGVTASHTIDGLGTFSALPGVEAELAAILGSDETPGIMSGSTDLDAAFTRASFADRLEEGRPVVHIASHFYMRAGNDADSFLLMGDGSTLTLAEINETAGLRFRGVELLTLSACSTALNSQGDFDVGAGTGAEVEGFGVLAQRKGAEAVLASLWDVADTTTSILMADLYTNLSAGEMSKAEALQAAQLALLEDPATQHPFYWAPFILMGNWK